MHKLPKRLAAGTKSKVAPMRKPKAHPVKTPPQPQRMNRMKLTNVALIEKHQKMMKLRSRGYMI